ncbi:MAG: tetratricopeptide repeat protein, partial [Chloroflexia bacterium]
MSRPNTQKRPAPNQARKPAETRPSTPAIRPASDVRRQTSSPTSQTRPNAQTPRFAIEQHRMVASIGLVLLILLTLFAPLSTDATATPLLTPQVDGANSVITGATSADLESEIFPYQTVIERGRGNLQSAWPDVGDVLDYDPVSLEARRAVVGQIFASSTGSLEIRVKDSGLEARPDSVKLDSLATNYGSMQDANRSTNGLAMLSFLVSLTSRNLEIRYNREREAIIGFQQAANAAPDVWQYTYNWGLANFVAGNYLSSYEAMRSIVGKDETKDFHQVKFWEGLAALRLGDPNEAIRLFNEVIAVQPPTNAADNVLNAFYEARDLSIEALGDAQWARRDTATAYKTYLNTLTQGKATYGLYRKWLRLGLEQHAYEQMIDDMGTLTGVGLTQTDLIGRIHHDRARLLSFMGRDSEAQNEYALALSTNGDDDPSLSISYAQFLLGRGDNDGALSRAEKSLRSLTKDLSAGDMVATANTVLTTTASLSTRLNDQEALDAHLVRAMAWTKQNKTDLVDTLVSNMTAGADNQSAAAGGLLYLYGGYIYEAAAQATSGDAAAALYQKAADVYGKAWAKLKPLAPGQQGRAASLAGQARTTALGTGKTVANGLDILKAGGYDPVTISPSVSNDPDADELLYAGAQLLEASGQQAQAANAYRVSGVLTNLQDAQNFSGVGRTLWADNGTFTPGSLSLRTADALRRTSNGDISQAVYRYKQAFGLSPALAPAWNNLGVLYAQKGNPAAKDYLALSALASPDYVLGNHNLATQAYKSGIGNFFTAEAAQGNAIKATGPDSLRWGYSLRYDDRSGLPAPSAPPVDFLVKLGALAILILLLLHTLVGHDRMTNRMGLIPTKGVIGQLGVTVDAKLKETFPRLLSPGTGSRSALVTSIVIPAVVGMIGLAWSAGHGSWEVALVFLPVSLLLAALSFGVNEWTQRWAANKAGASTLHHIWPTGILLGIVSIPFGFMYGWQNVTRLTMPDSKREGSNIKRGRTTDESDLLYEAQAEAAGDTGSAVTVDAVPAGFASGSSVGTGLFNLSPAA